MPYRYTDDEEYATGGGTPLESAPVAEAPQAPAEDDPYAIDVKGLLAAQKEMAAKKAEIARRGAILDAVSAAPSFGEIYLGRNNPYRGKGGDVARAESEGLTDVVGQKEKLAELLSKTTKAKGENMQQRRLDAKTPEGQAYRAQLMKLLSKNHADVLDPNASNADLADVAKRFEQYDLNEQKSENDLVRDAKKSEQTHKNRLAEIQAEGAQRVALAGVKPPPGYARVTDPVTGETRLEAVAKNLPPDKVLGVQEGASMPKTLADLASVLDKNKDLFGPARGRWESNNPYSRRGQAINSMLTSAAQTIGKYLEGGVLRKEDVPKYAAMLPKLSDRVEVAQDKLALIERKLKQKHMEDLKALRAQGYSVEGFDTNMQVPELPGALTKGGGGGVIKEAHAAEPKDEGPPDFSGWSEEQLKAYIEGKQ